MFPMKTERLILREYKKKDASELCRIFAQPQVYAMTIGIPQWCNKPWCEWWISTVRQNARQHTAWEFGVFLPNGQYIGNIGIINVDLQHKKGEITYIIDTALCNNGFATEAAKRILEFGFQQLKLKRVGGLCMSVNRASRRVMEKIGMTYEGTARSSLCKNGVFYDIDHLSILDNEFFTNSNIPKI